MNQNVIIGVVVAVVVVGGGAWLLTNRGMSGQEGMNQQRQSQSQGTGTFASLMSMGGSFTCDVTTNFDGAVSTGKMYINGQTFRGDFSSTINNQAMTTHMIHTGDYVWTWTDGTAQGFKMPIPESTEGEASASTEQFDVNQNVEYSCSPWIVDQALLTPPNTIDFMELGESGMPSGVPTMPTGAGASTGAGAGVNAGEMPSPEEIERMKAQYGY